MILRVQQGLRNDGVTASLSQLCRWFDVPRRTVYYQAVKAKPKVDAQFAVPIKEMIEENPSFGYRTVAHLLGFNKNTVQRIFQLQGWQVRKRAIGMRPRIQALPSVAKAPNERWSTDLCRIWAGRDGWASLALVIDCHTRELLGWHLSRTGRATTSSPGSEHLGQCPSRSCCDPTMDWCSPAAITRPWSEATGCARSSSPRTARSKTAWSNA
jgi:putative transposase